MISPSLAGQRGLTYETAGSYGIDQRADDRDWDCHGDGEAWRASRLGGTRGVWGTIYFRDIQEF